MSKILQLLIDIKQLLIIHSKEVFTLEEFADYCGISKHTAYKYTSNRQLPFYRVGKLIYIKKEEAIEFILKNRIASAEELNVEALSHL